MTKDEALNIAIDYMNERLEEHDAKFQRHPAAEAERNNILADIEAVKEALAQPEQDWSMFEAMQESLREHMARIKELELHLAQPEQEQLMSDQINYGMSVTQNGKRIDPMSIYKEPEQEPVTWRYKIVDVFGRPAWTLKTPKSDTRVLESQPLYTTLPQRKPLTDGELRKLADKHLFYQPEGYEVSGVFALARAIEVAHGIKGEA
jgi:hypothetical protein